MHTMPGRSRFSTGRRPPGSSTGGNPDNPAVTMTTRDLENALAGAGGVLRVRDHPELAWAIRQAVGSGELVRPLPGVVVGARLCADPDARILAAALWRPGGVLLGRAAARLGFDPELRVETVEIAGRHGLEIPGFRVVENRIDPSHAGFRGRLAFTAPSLTVVDLLREGDEDPLYDALRTRAVTLTSLHEALRAHPQRAGNDLVRRQLWRARENPWSRGEAELHDFLRRQGIQGWKGNARLQIGGLVYYIDALFGRERLALELDGLGHHTSPADREYDYRRRALLMAEGYRVLGLTLGMIRTNPERLAERIAAARAITRPRNLQATGRYRGRAG